MGLPQPYGEAGRLASYPTKSYLRRIDVCKPNRKHTGLATKDVVASVSDYQQTKAPRAQHKEAVRARLLQNQPNACEMTPRAITATPRCDPPAYTENLRRRNEKTPFLQ